MGITIRGTCKKHMEEGQEMITSTQYSLEFIENSTMPQMGGSSLKVGLRKVAVPFFSFLSFFLNLSKKIHLEYF